MLDLIRRTPYNGAAMQPELACVDDLESASSAKPNAIFASLQTLAINSRQPGASARAFPE
jgi:hypothetical protein